MAHKDILLKLEKIESRLSGHDSDIETVFEYIKQLLNPPPVERRPIGFRQRDNE